MDQIHRTHTHTQTEARASAPFLSLVSHLRTHTRRPGLCYLNVARENKQKAHRESRPAFFCQPECVAAAFNTRWRGPRGYTYKSHSKASTAPLFLLLRNSSAFRFLLVTFCFFPPLAFRALSVPISYSCVVQTPPRHYPLYCCCTILLRLIFLRRPGRKRIHWRKRRKRATFPRPESFFTELGCRFLRVRGAPAEFVAGELILAVFLRGVPRCSMASAS